LDAFGETEAMEGPLLEASHADSGAGFEAIVRAHLPDVVRIAQRFGLEDDEAEDVAQECFLRVWRGLRSFRRESQLRSWILRIAIRESSRRLSRRRRTSRGWRALDDETPASSAETADSAAQRVESRARLRQALAAMPARHREVLVLHYIEEMPCEEVSRILGCSLGTVHSRLHHARARLKEILGTP
jgi:RNA polymerase sigma-70 factor (ECF subfamily)